MVVWSAREQDGSGWGVYGQRYSGEGTAVGAEFSINSLSSDSNQKAPLPRVASLPDGGFVVAWDSYGHEGTGWEIYGQRYDSEGLAVGNEFLINSYTADDQHNPNIASLPDGGFIVTWESQGQDGSGEGIFAQRFNADGTIYYTPENFDSGNITEDSAATNTVTGVMIASDVDHGAVLTWTLNGQPVGTMVDGIYGSMTLSANGEWTYTLDNTRSTTQSLTQGQQVTESFTATITDEHGANSAKIVTITVTGVKDVVLAADVTVAGTEDSATITGTVHTNTNAELLSYALLGDAPSGVVFNADGTFRVTPLAADQGLDEGESRTVNFQYVANDGTVNSAPATVTVLINGVNDVPVFIDSPLSTIGEFRVSTDGHFQEAPRIAGLSDGGFIAVWQNSSLDGSDIYGQRFDKEGHAVGTEFQVNTYTADFQRSPDVAALADGGFVVAWASEGVDGAGQDGSGGGVYAQRFGHDGAQVQGEIQINSASLGSQSAPHVASMSGYFDGFWWV